MTGGELIPVVKGAASMAKKALSDKDEVQKQLLEMSKDTPDMKAAAQTYAKRVALKQAILLKLYEPLGRLVGISKAYFAEGGGFAADLAVRIADIPDRHLTSPSPSVAIPAMQALGYSLEEPDLKAMYLNLLATATDARRSEQAHPSFAEIIKQLSAPEAALLLRVLPKSHTIVRLDRVLYPREKGKAPIQKHVLPLLNEADEPFEEPSLGVWVDNWIRLGLVEVDYTLKFFSPGLYDWVEQRAEFQRAVESNKHRDPDSEDGGCEAVHVQQGILDSTDFGKRFFEAVTADQDSAPLPVKGLRLAPPPD